MDSPIVHPDTDISDQFMQPEGVPSDIQSRPVLPDIVAQPILDREERAKHRAQADKGSLTTSLLSAATATPLFGQPVEPEVIGAQVESAKAGTRAISRGIAHTYERWKGDETSKKVSKPILGSLAWANLVFGDTLAVAAQGIAQSSDATNTQSLAVGIGAMLAVEAGFAVPVALKNKEKQSAETVAEAAATAFWLGGAMGVENKKLPLRQTPYAIGAYMIMGTALVGAAEYNNLAEQAVDHKEVIIPALLIWGGMKKISEYFGHKTFSDRMADKSVKKVRTILRRNK